MEYSEQHFNFFFKKFVIIYVENMCLTCTIVVRSGIVYTTVGLLNV